MKHVGNSLSSVCGVWIPACENGVQHAAFFPGDSVGSETGRGPERSFASPGASQIHSAPQLTLERSSRVGMLSWSCALYGDVWPQQASASRRDKQPRHEALT